MELLHSSVYADGIRNSGNPSGVMSFAFVPPVPGLSGHVELQRKYKSATGTEGFKYAPERKAKQQLKHLERLR